MKETLPEVYLGRNKIYRHTEITVQKFSLMSATLRTCYAFIHCVARNNVQNSITHTLSLVLLVSGV